MFFGADRIDVVREMILSETREERIEKALTRLLPMQNQIFMKFQNHERVSCNNSFVGSTSAWIFASYKEESLELATRLKMDVEKLRAKVRSLHEFNPMLGHRGCRLGDHLPWNLSNAGACDCSGGSAVGERVDSADRGNYDSIGGNG